MPKRMILGIALAAGLAAAPAFAVDFQHTGDDGWIEGWLSMEVVMNNGGFAASGAIDFLSDGTDGDITHESVSTAKGLRKLATAEVKLDKAHSGFGMGEDGVWDWEPITIDTNNGDNMATSWGLAAGSDNIEWHGILVMKSSKNRTATMHPAHDDYAQIWINGEQVYDNDQWTGAVRQVTRPTDVELVAGDNVLLFKCGESGGSAYVNLRFEDSESDIDIVPTVDGEFWNFAGLAVEAQDKAATTWAGLKSR
ncbi:hypothetical protein HN371_08360 [Candidatus Poribacteria bacterium]|nr:hypothetical protein [Candidatus Poribacteria bacterium]MBT5534750.1 hypothetical protein [Candidatus Poribacteria bacterium]MBT5712863.1 hypothetical protein [Candidatus Poribacteria bacterium]MBT7096690.1 hypothetical protein [Candidatus Poribacteria bacterium]MBT7808968.1 hypothetical protein [Candidatus Poribacteria bacterium]